MSVRLKKLKILYATICTSELIYSTQFDFLFMQNIWISMFVYDKGNSTQLILLQLTRFGLIATPITRKGYRQKSPFFFKDLGWNEHFAI